MSKDVFNNPTAQVGSTKTCQLFFRRLPGCYPSLEQVLEGLDSSISAGSWQTLAVTGHRIQSGGGGEGFELALRVYRPLTLGKFEELVQKFRDKIDDLYR